MRSKHERGMAMPDAEINSYFVDESGDLTLLGRRGKCLVGKEGISRCFMVGMAHIVNPLELFAALESLRADLLAKPYLKSIPSMSPSARKTALCFHAKDDCPEVRMAVFELLAANDIKVQVGIRRKEALHMEAISQGKSWNANEVYDNLIKILFKRSLHTAQSTIWFARRGKSSREKLLQQAIDKAKLNFRRDTGISSEKPTRIVPAVPSEVPGLQVIDYFLWALQRLFERGEDRYFEFLRPSYRLIMDFDDKRTRKPYGRWYSDGDPITKEKLMPVTS